jgi:hypothetical protein
LGAIPALESIEPLAELLATEHGRLRQDIVYALSSITRGQHDKTAAGWRRWWNDRRDEFKIDAAATRDYRRKTRVQDIQVEALAEFYEGQIVSARIVFVLDTSGSMLGKKIESLKSTMHNTLGAMPRYAKFNVVSFASAIRVLKPGTLIPSAQRGKAMAIIYDLSTVGATRSFDAMEVAARLPGMDTLVYLSDGEPTAGQFQAWGSIVRSFGLYNRYRPIAMHCVYLAGEGPNGQPPKSPGMQALADRNAGHFTQPNP